jgi:energy-coupling factor transport system ATP-binding protein
LKAGKTTLVKHLNGLLKPTRGTVLINGVDTREASVAELSRTVGYVFQNANHSLFAETVEQELQFTLKNLNFTKEDAEKKVEKTLSLLDLTKYRNKSPFTLSGGERKRVALASVLCAEPQILILDEPTTGQDANQKRKLQDLLHQMTNEGKTIIIVSHDVEFVSEFVDRIIAMSQGVIFSDGPTNKILSNQTILKEVALRPSELTRLSISIDNQLIKFPTHLLRVDQVRQALNTHFRRK